MPDATFDYDANHNEPKFDRAIWHTYGSSGDVPVLILAYSLGATRAYCLTHVQSLIAGNYSAVWLPVNQLTILIPGVNNEALIRDHNA